MKKRRVGPVLCCLLAGCAASSERYVDSSRASVLVVRGYLESGKLHRSSGCKGADPGLEVQCAPPPPSIATFVVEENIVGAPARKRLRVSFGYSPHWPEVMLGKTHQYLAAIVSDGSAHELEGVARVARTTEGGWAIPIGMERETHLFPCSMHDVEPEPLRFQEPRPNEPLGDMANDPELVDEFNEGDAYTVEKGYQYADKGVSLAHVPAAYEGKSPDTVSGECH
jgi:hypothetical protein